MIDVYQGGALVLAFATRSGTPPAKETVSLLSGVVASSPFIHRATPTARHVRIIGWLLSLLFPNMILHTPINPNVSTRAAGAACIDHAGVAESIA